MTLVYVIAGLVVLGVILRVLDRLTLAWRMRRKYAGPLDPLGIRSGKPWPACVPDGNFGYVASKKPSEPLRIVFFSPTPEGAAGAAEVARLQHFLGASDGGCVASGVAYAYGYDDAVAAVLEDVKAAPKPMTAEDGVEIR
jgi:hypothetical protein